MQGAETSRVKLNVKGGADVHVQVQVKVNDHVNVNLDLNEPAASQRASRAAIERARRLPDRGFWDPLLV